MNLLQVDDLLSVPGFTPEILEKLRPYIIVLETPTTVNINTASAEVIHAVVESLSISDARAIIMARRNKSFTSLSDGALVNWLKDPNGLNNIVSVTTNYFLINGKVRLNRAGMQMQALIKRVLPGTQAGVAQGSSQVIWIREF
jgi:general secretion pathway protein K